MPWSTCYGNDGVDCRFTGATHGAEVIAANEEVFNHRYAGGLRYAIVDFSQAESLNLPTADLLSLAEIDRQYLLRNPPFALAIIAPQGVAFGAARTFERFMEGSPLKSTVVQTRQQALGWLRNLEVPVRDRQA
jgi:hypothetical protein